MVATLVGFLIAPNVIVTVPSGHVGILWKRFRGGTQLDPRLLKDEGMRVLLPWDKLVLYDLRVNQAWVKALGRAGVLRPAEVRRLTRGLEAIRTSVEVPSAGRREASRRNVSTQFPLKHAPSDNSNEKQVRNVFRLKRVAALVVRRNLRKMWIRL